MGDRTDNWEELVQSQENRLYRAALAILHFWPFGKRRRRA